MTIRTTSFMCLMATGLTVPALAGGSTLTVPTDFPTIQVAILAAGNGDTIDVMPGTYFESLDFGGKDLTLRGVGGSASTMISGATVFRPMEFDQSEVVTVEGFTLLDGLATGDGGAVRIVNSTITFNDVVFQDNHAGLNGGAINMADAITTFTACRFANNTCAGGRGGAVNADNSRMTFENCDFEANICETLTGGAIQSDDSQLTITESVFSGNIAFLDGGAIEFLNSFNGNSAAFPNTVTNSVFVGNLSNGTSGLQRGGAIFTLNGARPTLTQCLFVDNVATDEGGALWLLTNEFTAIRQCTFYNNAANVGGAIFSAGINGYVCVNSIFRENEASGVPNDIVGPGSATYCVLSIPFAGTGNIDADPLFVDALNGNFRLTSGSPAIDAGNTPIVPFDLSADPDGNIRVVAASNDAADTLAGVKAWGLGVDVGIYEFQPEDIGIDSCPSDITPPGGNGIVNIDDLLKVINDFGACPPAS
ncbi:MAG: hypothetical protein AAF432_03080 [Planctomycetota bacterium]